MYYIKGIDTRRIDQMGYKERQWWLETLTSHKEAETKAITEETDKMKTSMKPTRRRGK